MRKTFIVLLVFLTGLLIPANALASETMTISAMPKNIASFTADQRLQILKDFLNYYNSPLADYAENFIEAADAYQIDWRLLPAITGVESTFGKNIPFNSYNAYGWNNGNYRFTSWAQSIDYVARYLKEKYISRGLDNPYKIAPVYAPPSKTWAFKVDYFMGKISQMKKTPTIDSLTLLL